MVFRACWVDRVGRRLWLLDELGRKVEFTYGEICNSASRQPDIRPFDHIDEVFRKLA